MSEFIRVVGFDPSMSNWGMVATDVNCDSGEVVVVDMKVASTNKTKNTKQIRVTSDDLRRAKELYALVIDFIAKSNAKLIMTEISTGGSPGKGTRLITAFGVCTGILASLPLPIIEVTPLDVKLAATGIRTASKEEMIEWAVQKHPEAKWKQKTIKGVKSLTNDNEHSADALGAIYAGMKTAEFKAIMQIMSTMNVA